MRHHLLSLSLSYDISSDKARKRGTPPHNKYITVKYIPSSDTVSGDVPSQSTPLSDHHLPQAQAENLVSTLSQGDLQL